MEQLQRQTSNLLATEVVRQFTQSIPVDVHSLAEALDLRVVATPLSDDISGKIERDWVDGDGFMVTVNSRHSRVRQRFTVAHEIAHFILHRDLIGDGIIDDALYRDARIGDSRERQANTYAAQLLMPRQLVRQAWDQGHDTASKLSRIFEVSPEVAGIRMRELGCVLWQKTAEAS